MDSRKGSIRTIIVCILVAAAVFQTGMLWLNGNSSHNFFYYVSGIFRNTNESSNILAVSPAKTAVGDGDSTFSLLYGGENDAVEYSGNIISDLVSSSDFENSKFMWSDVLKYRCTVLVFSFSVPLNEYTSSFNKKANLSDVDVNNFQNIVVVPSDDNENSTVYFVSSDDENKSLMLRGKSQYTNKLINAIENISKSDNGIKYISTSQSGFNIFNSNIFVAQWTQDKFQYNTLVKTPAIKVSNKNEFESETDEYFKDYSGRRTSVDSNNTYTESNNTTVLKYYDDGVLEYFNYNDSNTNSKQTLSSAYFACVQFLKNDSSIKTNYYLSDVKMTGDGLIFLFDYYVNNMPVVLAKDLSIRTDMDHAMEIVVKGNTVKKFKKYAYNYSLGSKKAYADRDFLSAMNDAMAGGINANMIDDMVFGYMDENVDNMECNWFVKTPDTVFCSKAVN
ncbi:MAG: hypothetical protein LKJ13_00040 [Clostridia bacterium]|jgi:hypothetical protein|nr:hypothetical protein [Clostridia bacterium]MCI1999309.1 hypothetical protein [Clostridia bacterium]MCI2014738.1 hypothetical protein [Clostridia bacterium]